MSNVLQIDTQQVEDAIAQMKELITAIDEIDVTPERAAGDAGKVYLAVIEGEQVMEVLKVDMKKLIQTTADFLQNLKDRFETVDQTIANQM